MSHDAGLILTLAFAVVVAVLHGLGPRLRRVPGIEPDAGASLAGGLATGYVFIHVLPELARGNRAMAGKLDQELADTAVANVAVFLVALLGFFVFFVLQWAAEQAVHDRREPAGVVFAGHLVAFTLYNAVVVYIVPLRMQTSAVLAAVFCVILALHLVSTDRLLREQFPYRFAERPHARMTLAAGALGGWAAAAVIPDGTLALSLLSAFLGGAILLNVLDQELPARHEVRIAWFAAGLAVAATVLTALAAAGERGAA